MRTPSGSRSFLLLFLLPIFSLLLLLLRPASALRKSYVVYLGEHPHSRERHVEVDDEQVADAHYEFLGTVVGSKEKAQHAIFYSYTRHINGFAANLEEEEAEEISKHPDVVSVFPNRGRRLHTTHSWEFLGLERRGRVPKESLWKKARFGEDTIVGNLDTGVWPESESFNDDGMGPVPAKWKGVCQGVPCNRKLIGARYFNKGAAASYGPLNATFNTARDHDGHGTHTLSTAAGRSVPGASVFGYGNGTAKGGSPAARVAAYRVCYPPVSTNQSECFDADVLAGFEAAISDGVDVLSVSLGGDPADYFSDGVAIGSFHAVRRGVVVVCSAGNSGPKPATVSNVAPWILTVAASTADREFPAFVSLGSGKRLKGQSLSPSHLPREEKMYPLISSVDAKLASATDQDAKLCFKNSLDPAKVRGKIVACLRGINPRVEKGENVREAGGVGMVLANDRGSGNEVIADAHLLPATHLTHSVGLELFSYINSTGSPVGHITAPTTVVGTKPAPFMAAFSSQGPNTINPQLLKPDITAPGVSIIAAYTGASGPTNQKFDTRRVRFNSVSGTSMSCPHISGIVGLLKTLHPDWSPSAIKSAILTTARVRNNIRNPVTNASFVKATPFNYGSGHVRPNRAMDPGLVYDTTVHHYLNFLCSIGYNSTQVAKFSVEPYACPTDPPDVTDMNYPSITVPNLNSSATVSRTVKNVGPPGTYTARVVPPRGIAVTVEPSSLTFDKVGEERSFKVRLEEKRPGAATTGYVFGRLIWSDGVHHVRSPLVVKSAKG